MTTSTEAHPPLSRRRIVGYVIAALAGTVGVATVPSRVITGVCQG